MPPHATNATISMAVEWLCKHQPIVFTNRRKDQPLLADPFPIYQQVVKDNHAFFHDVHKYVPNPNTKTGLAGVRSHVYTETFRDHVILPALRMYRARMEGAALDTVPEVVFSFKPSSDGRADKSVAQRGILGFEPTSARKGYIYNPDRNPNLALPDLPTDGETSLLLYDKEADVLTVEMEEDYKERADAYVKVTEPVKVAKRKYMCTSCNVPKKGHICLKRKGAMVKRAVKRARK